MKGNLRKMISENTRPVTYSLPVGDNLVALNEFFGKKISLAFTGTINCIACGRKTSKSFNQGYCFPCMRTLAECDSCIVKPELCHFAKGTCRDAEWALSHCMQDHIVYLANSSGIKVGITRHTQIPMRWIDQGATQALPMYRVASRHISGLMEVIIKNHVADKTDWRKMLKGDPEPLDLAAQRDDIFAQCEMEIKQLEDTLPASSIRMLPDEAVTGIEYPVLEYPAKVASLSFDKTPNVTGALLGIKGQYLILDSGVINIRKFGGYEIEFAA
ncbi:MAG: DUF2797 domain-containing protein [Gammaproteobacteria bacterium]|nr:DUF2797 domain-containing protein [Gammaproteobacteria bacterium]